MKVINKKTILGFAMSMIFSLAIMQGISQKNVQQQDRNLQQLSIGASYIGASCEDPGAAAAWNQTSDVLEAAAGIAATGLGAAWVVSGTNPVGWATWAGVGLVAL